MNERFELIEGYHDIKTGLKIEITKHRSREGRTVKFSEINRVWAILLQELHKDDDIYKK